MTGRDNERWRELCKQAAVENDPDKLRALTKEINRILDEKQKRLSRKLSEHAQARPPRT